ncbi:transposase [Cyclobacteriaceae bacterium YHN15]|nr:transposase [Cyclobacteriaceae bacterium YHN15]
MERRYYSNELKDKAVQMYLDGKTSPQIAKEFDLPNPDMVRKWVQIWRKENSVPAENYRRSGIAVEVDEKMRLLNKIERVEHERDHLLMTLKLVCTGDIEGWEELLSFMKNKN